MYLKRNISGVDALRWNHGHPMVDVCVVYGMMLAMDHSVLINLIKKQDTDTCDKAPKK
jgi:hypothetical protein